MSYDGPSERPECLARLDYAEQMYCRCIESLDCSYLEANRLEPIPVRITTKLTPLEDLFCWHRLSPRVGNMIQSQQAFEASVH